MTCINLRAINIRETSSNRTSLFASKSLITGMVGAPGHCANIGASQGNDTSLDIVPGLILGAILG